MKPLSPTTLKDSPMRDIVDHAEHFSVFGYRAALLSCGHEEVYKARGQKRIRCKTCRDLAAALRDGSQERETGE